MKYMLLIYLEEQALSETERKHCYEESAQLAQDLNSSGQYLAANPLHPTSTLGLPCITRRANRAPTAPQRGA